MRWSSQTRTHIQGRRAISGTHDITLAIAGIPFQLRGFPDSAMPMVRGRYAAFACPDTAPEHVWDLDWDAPGAGEDPGPDPVRLSRSGAAWRMAMSDATAEWDADSGQGHARLQGNEYTLDGVLRVWLSVLLLHHANGGLFHAAGAVRRGRGRLFIGRSGAGKTTLAGTCAPGELLSDELVAVRRGDHGYRVYGTPFMGELGVGGHNTSAPLERFYILDRHAASGAHPVEPSAAAAELWGTLLYFGREPGDVEAALRLCNHMAGALPCQRLSFTPEQGPWRLLHDA